MEHGIRGEASAEDMRFVRALCEKDIAAGITPVVSTRRTLLTVEGELDDLSPPGHTRAALDLCAGLPASMKRAHLEIGVGHYGVFNGRKWRNNIQPKIHAFIREFTQSGTAAA